jgi:hypothetical protein
MHDIIFNATRVIVGAVFFFSMNANEFTIINNKQWVNVHVYVMKD